ncbi:MAG: hypothetical protein JWQ94_590, partial [Tardiphaga sp.]|nr:hypothetical protein [Tardiphaga sp.]
YRRRQRQPSRHRALQFAVAGGDDVDEVGIDQQRGMFENGKRHAGLVHGQRLHNRGGRRRRAGKHFGHRLAHQRRGIVEQHQQRAFGGGAIRLGEIGNQPGPRQGSRCLCPFARRLTLPASVCAAIAEVGSAAAALELIENPFAEMAPFSWDRIVERHGHLAAIRESMLVLEDLPAATRLALVAKLSETLTRFVVARNWLSADRAGRVRDEAMARSTVNIAARSRGDEMRDLVRHLRQAGQLTVGLILRSLLSGNMELFEQALAELSGVPLGRVSGIVYDGAGSSLNALLARAGLPESTYPAFRAALEARHEVGFIGSVGGAVRLRRRMVERVLTICETDEATSEPLLILLRRFATESAREEARVFCDELAEQARAFEYQPLAA